MSTVYTLPIHKLEPPVSHASSDALHTVASALQSAEETKHTVHTCTYKFRYKKNVLLGTCAFSYDPFGVQVIVYTIKVENVVMSWTT